MEHIDRSFAVSLQINHPNIDPSTITATLGLTPRRQHCAGDQRLRLDGAPVMAPPYPSFQLEAVRDLIPFLERTLSDLEKHRSFFHQISDAGGSTDLFCGIWITTNWDEEIPYQLSGRLAEFRINLRLDVYPKTEALNK
jgi:hypothetical protein